MSNSNSENIYLGKIKEGDVFKNYKELCNTLGEKVKSGKSKVYQIEDWERHFSYLKKGISFKILDIFSEPLPKIDGRSKGNNHIEYIEKIEFLLLNLLCCSANKGYTVLSKNKLLAALSMVNDNYVYGRSKPHKLSAKTEIEVAQIYDFYTTSDSLLKRNLMKAINNLVSKSLITYKPVMTVCTVENDDSEMDISLVKTESKNDFGDDETVFEIEVEKKLEFKHELATIDQERLIIATQRRILKEMEMDAINDVFKAGKSVEYYRRVSKALFEVSNIHYYYESYEIIFNEIDILDEYRLQSDSYTAIGSELNHSILENIFNNAQKRVNSSINREVGKQKEIHKTRLEKDYLKNINILNRLLINKDSEKLFL